MALASDPVTEQKDRLYRATWTRAVLVEENKAWLRSLPREISLELEGSRFLLRHASPWDETTYLYPDSKTLENACLEDGSVLWWDTLITPSSGQALRGEALL